MERLSVLYLPYTLYNAFALHILYEQRECFANSVIIMAIIRHTTNYPLAIKCPRGAGDLKDHSNIYH